MSRAREAVPGARCSRCAKLAKKERARAIEECAARLEARATSEQITADRIRAAWLEHERASMSEMDAATRCASVLREEAARLRATLDELQQEQDG